MSLVTLGARVRSLSLPSRKPLPRTEGVEYVEGDILDRLATRRAVSDAEVLIHTAAPVEASVWPGRRYSPVYDQGVQSLLQEAPCQARVVHVSSTVTIGAACTEMPLDEEARWELEKLAVPYVQGKRVAERLMLEAYDQGRDVVIVNPAYMIGPDDHGPSIMGRLLLRIWRGRVPAVLGGGINVVDVRDVATGILLATEYGVAGRRYILGGENVPFRDFVKLALQVAGWDGPVVSISPWLLGWPFVLVAGLRSWWTGREPYPSATHLLMSRYYWYVRWERAYQELGFWPRPLRRSLQDTFQWFATCHRLTLRRIHRLWVRAARQVPEPLAARLESVTPRGRAA
jgi:dihydroflavonol-4-reductase